METNNRSTAFGDFDNDGDIDVLIMNINEPPSLLRNDVSGPHHWLKVLLVGVESNRSAIGATVVATYGDRRQAQVVLAKSSYLSVNDRRLHFGLVQRPRPASIFHGRTGARNMLRTLPPINWWWCEGSGIIRREGFGREK